MTMNTLIVSDIFGRTDALEALAQSLSGHVNILDPYDSVKPGFSSESEAYEAFTQSVGMDRYAALVAKTVSRYTKPLTLIGFSAGASAIWITSDHPAIPSGSTAICFYGSQIRHWEQINPTIPTHLIFPEHEKHFDVALLMDSLSQKEKVTVEQVPYLHGFMNKQSMQFNHKGYHAFIQQLSHKGRSNK
ncbi:hypothetical protein [uncultured Endozoicomonas sp.]|uniref:hypothetical protein n=1 Tax=uncultured Endozoicomonas sp. TaxID=432652 RepID=UPI0026053A6A|nr:hypothetical protein [uncultured Endozoicomonas sp.]